MSIYVSDLPNTCDTRSGFVFLYCPKCRTRSSAHRGDYFLLNPNTKLRCGEHRPLVDLVLAREHITIEIVDPKELT